MDDIERNSFVPSIQPVLKIRTRLYDHERRDLRYPHERNRPGQSAKRKMPGIKRSKHPTSDVGTPEEIQQDFIEYKADLKTRLVFDRAQILPKEPSSN